MFSLFELFLANFSRNRSIVLFVFVFVPGYPFFCCGYCQAGEHHQIQDKEFFQRIEMNQLIGVSKGNVNFFESN